MPQGSSALPLPFTLMALQQPLGDTYFIGM